MKALKTLGLISIGLIVGCTVVALGPLRLQDRTLLIDPESAALIYPYTGEECKHPNRRIFRGCRPARKVIKYDLTDEKVRSNLIHAKFECQSLMRFKY